MLKINKEQLTKEQKDIVGIMLLVILIEEISEVKMEIDIFSNITTFNIRKIEEETIDFIIIANVVSDYFSEPILITKEEIDSVVEELGFNNPDAFSVNYLSIVANCLVKQCCKAIRRSTQDLAFVGRKETLYQVIKVLIGIFIKELHEYTDQINEQYKMASGKTDAAVIGLTKNERMSHIRTKLDKLFYYLKRNISGYTALTPLLEETLDNLKNNIVNTTVVNY